MFKFRPNFNNTRSSITGGVGETVESGVAEAQPGVLVERVLRADPADLEAGAKPGRDGHADPGREQTTGVREKKRDFCLFNKLSKNGDLEI